MQPFGLRHQIARLLFWIALLLGAAGITTAFAGLPILPPAAWIGAALGALGLNLLLGGELIAGGGPRMFAVRGQVVRGELIARAGFSDLSVGMGGIDRVATMHHGPLGKPKFSVEDGVAYLKMANPLLPNIAQWETRLAGNVLWDLDTRATLGNLSLDLSHLRAERISARTTFGRLEVKLPTRGYTQMFLKTGAGEIDVTMPTGTGVRVQIKRGRLGSIAIENERLIAVDGKRWATADYDAASTQVDIRIEAGAGDVFLR